MATASYWEAWYQTLSQYPELTRPTMKEVWRLIQDLKKAEVL